MKKTFTIWRFVIFLGWAKTAIWATTDKDVQRIYLVSVHILRQNDDKALGIVIGPAALILAFVNNKQKEQYHD